VYSALSLMVDKPDRYQHRPTLLTTAQYGTIVLGHRLENVRSLNMVVEAMLSRLPDLRA
jgi:hypothetical protein